MVTRSRIVNCIRRYQLAWFFLLAYVVSWAFWIPAAAASLGLIGAVPTVLLHYLGGLGPMVSALVIAAIVRGKDESDDFVGRMTHGGAWIILAIAVPAALFALSALLVAQVYRTPIDWQAVGISAEAPWLPRPIVWLAILLCYGYGEEVGWRGFALPRLQRDQSALRASWLVTLGWAGWHAPLFAFSNGLSNLGVAGTVGWFFSLALGSILLTSLFNSSNGSIAAVAFFHASLDVFMTASVSPQLPGTMGALLTIGTLALVPVLGPRNLAFRLRVTAPTAFARFEGT